MILSTEACNVEVSLVLKYQGDVDESNVVQLGSANSGVECGTSVRQVKNSTDSLEEGVLGLCPAVRLCILPKPVKQQ